MSLLWEAKGAAVLGETVRKDLKEARLDGEGVVPGEKQSVAGC